MSCQRNGRPPDRDERQEERRDRRGAGNGSAHFVEFDLLAGALVHLRLGQSLRHSHQEQLEGNETNQSAESARIIAIFQIYRFFLAAFELGRVVDAPQEPVLGAV